MERICCVELPALPLQLVSAERIEDAVASLFALLLNFSPRVEPEPGQPGTFWVDPSGMALLWSDLGAWASSIQGALSDAGYAAAVIVGFHRFRAYAIACVQAEGAPARVLGDRRSEAQMAANVGLDRLAISPRLRDELASLGVRTLGEFMALPGPELRVRFGVEAERLHKRGSDDHWDPIHARPLVDPISARVQLDPPVLEVAGLLFRIKPVLEGLLGRLAERGLAMSALHLRLLLDHANDHDQRLEPASPTLDTMQVLDLLRLRLDTLALAAGVEEFILELEGQRSDPQQIALFRAQARRDLEAGGRALAQLRAALGPEAVTCPRLRAAHLPEARFSWAPTVRLRLPDPTNMQVEGELAPRIRRLLHRPKQLAARDPLLRSGVLDPRYGPLTALDGPFRASGGWWVREVDRDYYFATISGEAVLWVFYDRPRRRWYLQGWVD